MKSYNFKLVFLCNLVAFVLPFSIQFGLGLIIVVTETCIIVSYEMWDQRIQF